MPKFLKLETRTHRALFIAFVLCILLGFAYVFSNHNILNPNSTYFYTVELGGEKFIDKGNMHGFEDLAVSNAKRFVERCRKYFFTTITGEYRGLELCNPAKIAGPEFQALFEQFKKQVDQMYLMYYLSWAKEIMTSILAGIAAWTIIVFIMFLSKWLLKPEK